MYSNEEEGLNHSKGFHSCSSIKAYVHYLFIIQYSNTISLGQKIQQREKNVETMRYVRMDGYVYMYMYM